MLPSQCPQCGGATEKGGKSCSCGWTAGSKKREEKAEDRQCAYVEQSVRCELEGWLSKNTRGGPWYCREHFGRVNGWKKPEQPEPKNPEHMQRIRELIASRKRPIREPGEDEVEA